MTSRLNLMRACKAAFNAGDVADAAAYKSALLCSPAYPEVENKLGALQFPFPAISLERLRQCPPGSFGKTYDEFLSKNGLHPLVVSDRLTEVLGKDNILAVRYIMVHDAFHVLLDFDVGLPGELGVWAFVREQQYCSTYRWAATAARISYFLMSPSQGRALRAAWDRGTALARQAECLIAQLLEQFWDMPLPAVREKLGLHAAI